MKGEVKCKDRAYNSLLEEYVDFDVASKLPPKITQETTNSIEELVRQRVLDEMFDDPVRRALPEGGDAKQEMLSFTKSGKGLGDVYADEFAKKMDSMNPDAFLSTAEDGPLKTQVEEIFTNVMRSLNQLSHVHFTPKKITEKAAIRTQNVAAI